VTKVERRRFFLIHSKSLFPTEPTSRRGGFAVKRQRFSVEQMVAVLKQAEVGVPVAELIRKLGISEQVFLTVGKAAQGLRGRLGAPGETVAGGERPARTGGADLALDRQILQEVVSRKR
jgi:putative transposase